MTVPTPPGFARSGTFSGVKLRTLYNICGVLVTMFTVALAWQQARWRRINGDSRAVARWNPAARTIVHAGSISSGVAGDEHSARAIVVLHGLTTTGEYFGDAWDTLAADGTRLVVPDLPGFGRSIDRARSADDHTIERHAAAVEQALPALVDPHAHLTVVAHSMGCLVALRLADLPGSRVDSVVLIAPTLHDTWAEAERHVSDRGLAARIFGLDRWTSRVACRNICTRPWLARWLARTIAPAMPTEIADRTHLHTWESQVGTLRSTFARREWRGEIDRFCARGGTVTMCVGDRDNAIDRALIADLAATSPNQVRVLVREGSGHQVPLTDAEWCVDSVRAAVAELRRGDLGLAVAGYSA